MQILTSFRYLIRLKSEKTKIFIFLNTLLKNNVHRNFNKTQNIYKINQTFKKNVFKRKGIHLKLFSSDCTYNYVELF